MSAGYPARKLPLWADFSFLKRGKEHPKELRDETPLPNEKERDERSLHGVPGPCSQVRPLLLAELKRDTPRNFDMNRLIWNAFYERPISKDEIRGWCWEVDGVGRI